MKSPSKNIPASLRSQSPSARQPLRPKLSRVKTGGPAMTVPGEGTVQLPPGTPHERSAKHYGLAIKKFGVR